MDDSAKKALDFISQAEKKLKSSTGFLGNLMGGNSKVEDAADLYTKAGHSFKISKKWKDAGNAYSKAASIQLQLENRLEGASNYNDAANCFKKISRDEAITIMRKVIDIYVDMGRFAIAAKHYMEMAEMYEQEPADLIKSSDYYQKAADFYQGEESKSSANRCLLKVAQYCAEMEVYDRASVLYEQIAISSLDNPLLRHVAKEHFVRASVCRMCLDSQDGMNAISKYSDLCTNFADSREVKLLKALLTALEENEEDAFTEAIKNHDSISRLDAWFVTMFTRIKRRIQVDSELL